MEESIWQIEPGDVIITKEHLKEYQALKKLRQDEIIFLNEIVTEYELGTDLFYKAIMNRAASSIIRKLKQRREEIKQWKTN